MFQSRGSDLNFWRRTMYLSGNHGNSVFLEVVVPSHITHPRVGRRLEVPHPPKLLYRIEGDDFLQKLVPVVALEYKF